MHNLTVTAALVREAAKQYPDAQSALKKLFPEAFAPKSLREITAELNRLATEQSGAFLYLHLDEELGGFELPMTCAGAAINWSVPVSIPAWKTALLVPKYEAFMVR